MTVTWTTPISFNNGAIVTVAQLNSHLRDNIQYLYNSIPNRAIMRHEQAAVLLGNAIARVFNSSQYDQIYANQSTAAQNDSFTHSCYLREGTYTFNVLGVLNTNCGKVDWYLDNNVAISGAQGQDWYGSLALNTIKSTANVSIVGSGYHVLKGVVSSKNASSSGYTMPLTAYWFVPTVAD